MNSYPYKEGDKVEIVESPYKRIPSGTLGTVESICRTFDGTPYGIDVTDEMLSLILFFDTEVIQPYPLLEVPEAT